jgi:hypothetical protein
MARKMRKFSAGGAQGKYDRRMADIKKDFEKDSKGKTGRALEVLTAKRAQRTADAEDDRAKRMGTDRTATRKAEYDAEKNLSRTRKFGADKPAATVEPAKASTPEPVKASEPAKAKPQSFGAAFKEARSRLGAGKTFTYNGKSFTTNIAGEGRRATPPAAAKNNPPAAATPTKVQRNYNISPENRKAIDAAAKKTPFSVFDKTAFDKLKSAGAPPPPPPPPPTPRDPKQVAYEKAINDRDKELGKSLAVLNPFGSKKDRAAAYEAKLKAAGKLAKGGTVKKEKIMKYAKGGSTTSKPPQPSAADRARSKAQLDSLKKAKPTAAEGKVAGSANRSEGPGYKKGGKMATKFGAAMKKKSADTKGRAMPKFAKGGSIDGCAVKGKTKTSMVKMKNGGSC